MFSQAVHPGAGETAATRRQQRPYFFTGVPEFCLDSNACSAAPGGDSLFHSMRLCVLARASAFYEDDMRRLLVCACVSLVTVSGIAGVRAAVEASDQVPSGIAGTPEHPAKEEPATQPAIDKPVVARSNREICDTLIEFGSVQ